MPRKVKKHNSHNDDKSNKPIEGNVQPAWLETFELATGYYHGGPDTGLPNYDKAMKLYKKAYIRGAPSAARKIGDMYLSGRGAKVSIDNALKYYNLGIKGKDYLCYLSMAYLISNRTNQPPSDVMNYYDQFFTSFKLSQPLYGSDVWDIVLGCERYFRFCIENPTIKARQYKLAQRLLDEVCKL